MRARWYDPDLGRFLSEDPIGLAGGINYYLFAANDPINLADPSGLQIRLPGITVVGDAAPPLWRGFLEWLRWMSRGGGGDPRSRGGGGAINGGQGQGADYTPRDECPALNATFRRQLDAEFDLASREQLERGGTYGAPWTNPLRMTAVRRGRDWLDIPLEPGVSGYWHTHQNPPPTHLQGPGLGDVNWARRIAHSTFIAISLDSLFIIYPTDSIIGCAR